MKKIFSLFLVFFLVFLLSTQSVSAKKTLGNKASTSSTGGPVITAKLRSDRLAIIVNFNNLNTAKSVSYTLSYNTNGVSQGVSGTIRPTTSATSRELLFGTCSSGVCRYHSNITNARLVVTNYLKSGGRTVKSFRVKP